MVHSTVLDKARPPPQAGEMEWSIKLSLQIGNLGQAYDQVGWIDHRCFTSLNVLYELMQVFITCLWSSQVD